MTSTYRVENRASHILGVRAGDFNLTVLPGKAFIRDLDPKQVSTCMAAGLTVIPIVERDKPEVKPEVEPEVKPEVEPTGDKPLVHMNKAELISLAEERGLPTDGTRKELIARLKDNDAE